MIYKNFQITTKKVDEGYYMICLRNKDNWVLSHNWSPNIKTKKEAIEECKIIIDDYSENPANYKD